MPRWKYSMSNLFQVKNLNNFLVRVNRCWSKRSSQVLQRFRLSLSESTLLQVAFIFYRLACKFLTLFNSPCSMVVLEQLHFSHSHILIRQTTTFISPMPGWFDSSEGWDNIVQRFQVRDYYNTTSAYMSSASKVRVERCPWNRSDAHYFAYRLGPQACAWCYRGIGPMPWANTATPIWCKARIFLW